jgi:hypothetical protein
MIIGDRHKKRHMGFYMKIILNITKHWVQEFVLFFVEPALVFQIVRNLCRMQHLQFGFI